MEVNTSFYVYYVTVTVKGTAEKQQEKIAINSTRDGLLSEIVVNKVH